MSMSGTTVRSGEQLRLSRHGSVLLIEMVRDGNRNALTTEMKLALSEALVEASRPEVRCVVITGTGKAFCAGGDVKGMDVLQSPDAADKAMRLLHETIVLPLLRLAKPTIAAVNAVAAGAGVGLALACDFRVVSREADFVLAFSRIGLVPDFGVSYTLPRLVGAARAKELAFIKGRLTAEEASQWGLVTELCAPDAVLGRAMELAGQLAAGPTVALGLTKRMLDESLSSSVHEALRLEAESQRDAWSTTDHKIACNAFIQKNDMPSFQGR
ncbi:enoyl-CoA hydratase/isomerase family protein [Pseudarthrobacter siccitolerans]|nr:enoyl-CoA hydratase-related protein [Pseudarthrobacter siccitolerans]